MIDIRENKIQEEDIKKNIVSKLPNNPSAMGYSASQIKAKFDESVDHNTDVIVNAINEIAENTNANEQEILSKIAQNKEEQNAINQDIYNKQSQEIVDRNNAIALSEVKITQEHNALIDKKIQDFDIQKFTDLTNDINLNKENISENSQNINTLKNESVADITVAYNSTNGKMVFRGVNAHGEFVGTPKEVDLPIESILTNAEYDSLNKKIVLTFINQNPIEINIADLVDTYVGDNETIDVNGHTISLAQAMLNKINAVYELTKLVDDSQANATGTVSVSINSEGHFVFKNLKGAKGDTGNGIYSVTISGLNFIVTYTDGTSSVLPIDTEDTIEVMEIGVEDTLDLQETDLDTELNTESDNPIANKPVATEINRINSVLESTKTELNSSISSLTNGLNNKQDTLNEAQLNAVNSGITSESVQKISTNETNIQTINNKIPNQATNTNQLADKDFVNSSLNSIVAFYITKNSNGDSFSTKAELNSTTTFYSGGATRVPTRNDYCIVLSDETHDNATTRYIYNNGWEFQYVVNETALTAEQLSAINSGITATLVNTFKGKTTTKINGTATDLDFTSNPQAQINALKWNVNTTSASPITLTNNTSFRLGEIATLTINNATSYPLDFMCEIVFKSGSGFSMDYSALTITFSGDDCESGVFTPSDAKTYNILFFNNSNNETTSLQAIVRGV